MSPGLDLAGMNSASLGTGGASNGANGNGASAGGCASHTHTLDLEPWPRSHVSLFDVCC